MVKSVGIVLLGLGNVGLEVLRQISRGRQVFVDRFGLKVRVIAVGDSSGVLATPSFPQSCIDSKQLEEIIQFKEQKMKLMDFDSTELLKTSCPEILEKANSSVFLADCSAENGETMVEWMIQVLSRGGAAATANKKPLTCSMSQYSRFDQYSARFGRESTVGAGTPILACLDRVLFSGDKISQIQGAMSGTLGFVASKLENKAKFSDVVREAKRLGYTEPDPRDDLSGLDVARKALILSRISGMQAELEDVKIEALYPKSFANLDLEEFMDRLPELDEDMSAKVKDAESKGCVLRYLGTVDIPGNRIEVGLFQVPKNSVLGSLQGSDNLVSIVSEKFPASSPLVIRGSGAGSEVTAAGVVADIISIAKSSAF